MGYNPLLLNNCIDYANGAICQLSDKDNPWKQEEGGSVPNGAAPNLPASGGRYGGSGEGRTVC